jgi:putative oxidoreductase
MRNITLWTVTVVAAGMFALAGTLKLIGVPMEVDLFRAIGLGAWFRYVTGALEVAGAIGLLVPAVAAGAALLLAGVMIGAILTHLFIIGTSPLVPILLLAATLAIAWLRTHEPISSPRLRTT